MNLLGRDRSADRSKRSRLGRAAPALLGVRLARRTGTRALHPRQSGRRARPHRARFRRRLGPRRHRRGQSGRVCVVRRGDRSARARGHRPELAARTASSSSRSAIDIIGSNARWNTVLAGDMCYERPLAERLVPWLQTARDETACACCSAIRGATIFPAGGVREARDLRGPDDARSRGPRDARDVASIGSTE